MRIGDVGRPPAVRDGHVQPRTRHVMQEPRPRVPRRLSGRVGDRVHEVLDAFQRLDLLGVLTDGELDLRLLHDGVDPPGGVRLGARHGAEPLQRHLEMADGLGVGPPPLGLLAREDRIVDGLLRFIASFEMVRDELDDLVEAVGIELLQPHPACRVEPPAAAFQHSVVRHLLRQRMLEGIQTLGTLGAQEDEVQVLQVPKATAHLIGGRLEKPGQQGDPEPTADHRRTLQRLLERIRQPVDAGRDDIVDRRRHRHIRPREPCLARVDDDAARLLQLTEDLLDVQRIAFALLGENPEELIRDSLGGEQRLDHLSDVPGTEEVDGQ